MKNIYFFNADGSCYASAMIEDENLAVEMAVKNNAHDFAVANEKHQIDGIYHANSALHPMPMRPAPHCIFDFATKQWQDPRTLADLKAQQWALIKQARTQAEYSGFTWDGSTFDSDAISQNRITGAVALAQMSSTFSIGWVLADNTVRTLNQSDMLAVGAALGAHVAAVFAKGVLLREQIESATTVQQIEAVVW
jgi:hypothetical protein